MADEANEAEDTKPAEGAAPDSGEEKKKSGGKGKIFIIAGIVLVMIGIQVGSAFVIVKAIKGEDPVKIEQKRLEMEKQEAIDKRTAMGMVLEKPIEATVNLIGGKRPRYLKCKLQLEWDGVTYPELTMKITERMARIQDIIIDILGTQNAEELANPAFKRTLREKIKVEINNIIPPDAGSVSNVYFQEFIVQ